jgi:hypothetical protein
MQTAAVTSQTQTLATLLSTEGVTQPQLAAHLDALDADGRVREIRALSGPLQKRLWEVCANAPAFTVDDLVPPSLGEGKTVIWAGKNSLAAFTRFEKHFARLGGKVIGFNHQTMSWITGPGFFTCKASPQDPRELLFDYTDVPSQGLAEWPQPRANERGFSYFVYRGLHDFNRRVSKDVIIGFATRLGKPIDSYFVLART